MMYRSRPEICPSSAHACSNHAVTCPEHLNIQFELLYAFLYTESRLLIVLLSFYGFARIPSKPESVRFPSRRSSVAPAGAAGPGERPCAPVCARANRRGPGRRRGPLRFPGPPPTACTRGSGVRGCLHEPTRGRTERGRSRWAKPRGSPPHRVDKVVPRLPPKEGR